MSFDNNDYKKFLIDKREKIKERLDKGEKIREKLDEDSVLKNELNRLSIEYIMLIKQINDIDNETKGCK